jgi:hypothetical protein
MDGWQEVVSITNVRKTSWVLEPRFFEMRVEDGLTVTVENTSRDDIGLDSFPVESNYFIFNFFYELVFFDWVSKFIVKLREC